MYFHSLSLARQSLRIASHMAKFVMILFLCYNTCSNGKCRVSVNYKMSQQNMEYYGEVSQYPGVCYLKLFEVKFWLKVKLISFWCRLKLILVAWGQWGQWRIPEFGLLKLLFKTLWGYLKSFMVIWDQDGFWVCIKLSEVKKWH